MILAIDIGNTNIVVGCIDEQKTYFIERVSTDRSKTELEYAIVIKNVLDIFKCGEPQRYKHRIDNSIKTIIKSRMPPSTALHQPEFGPFFDHSHHEKGRQHHIDWAAGRYQKFQKRLRQTFQEARANRRHHAHQQ